MASIVVISAAPTLSTGVIQERVATPSTCTVQAPHSAIPQPNFVPVMPSTSRKTHNRGVSPSTSTLCVLLLTLMGNAMGSSFLRRYAISQRERRPLCKLGALLFFALELDHFRTMPH